MSDGNTYVQILLPSKLYTGFQQTTEQAVDLGGYKTLEIAFLVLAAGSGTGGETLELESAATRDGEYFPITGADVKIDSTGASKHVQADSFLRYVRAKVVGTVAGNPAAGIDAIAKK